MPFLVFDLFSRYFSSQKVSSQSEMSSSHSSFMFRVKKEDMKLHRPSMCLMKVIFIQNPHGINVMHERI